VFLFRYYYTIFYYLSQPHGEPPFPVRSVLCVFYDMMKIMYSNVAANSVRQSNRLQNRFDYTNYLFQLNTIKNINFLLLLDGRIISASTAFALIFIVFIVKFNCVIQRSIRVYTRIDWRSLIAATAWQLLCGIYKI
jgi:hypothetical protein